MTLYSILYFFFFVFGLGNLDDQNRNPKKSRDLRPTYGQLANIWGHKWPFVGILRWRFRIFFIFGFLLVGGSVVGMRMIGGNPDQLMQALILLMKSQISVTHRLHHSQILHMHTHKHTSHKEGMKKWKLCIQLVKYYTCILYMYLLNVTTNLSIKLLHSFPFNSCAQQEEEGEESPVLQQ